MTRKNYQYLIILFSIIWVICTAILFKPETAQTTSAAYKGFTAPDFVLNDQAGNEVRLSEYRGQAVLLNLWASWCQPCRAEMPAMERVYLEKADEKFTILAVNMTQQDNITSAKSFVTQNQLSFPILFDIDGTVERLYKMQALPTSYFIDPAGVIRSVVIGGPMPESLILSKIAEIMETE